MGLISADDVAESESRHVLTRSLGPELFVSPDTTAVTLQTGDVLVLCTDGVHDKVSGNDDRARLICAEQAGGGDCAGIGGEAVEIDGDDNATAQVIRVRAVEQVGMYRGRPSRRPDPRI